MNVNGTTRFSFNPQDRTVMQPSTVDVKGVGQEGGNPATDLVTVRAFEVEFFMGNPVDIKPAPDFRLNPSAGNDYVFQPGDESFTSANVFAGAATTAEVFQGYYKEMTGKDIKWATPEDKLGVSPESGDWANAFYARELGGLFFFDFGASSSTGDSGEVVSHETGHAILDALRPEWRELGHEVNAYHEAFGDVMAMLMTLRSDEALDKLVEQTGGDLFGGATSKRNLMSEMGEEMGREVAGGKPIRSAFNNFVYQDPNTLPDFGDDDSLGREAHDFARLWTGAFYELLDGLADSNRAAGMPPKEALRAAGDEGFRLLVGQMENAARGGDITFKDLAGALLQGDAQFNGGKRQDLIADVFGRRGILDGSSPSDIFASASASRRGTHTVAIDLGSEFGDLAGAKVYSEMSGPKQHSLDGGPSPAEAAYAARLKEDIKSLAQGGDILVTEQGQKPGIGDFFKEDGSAYTAYLDWNENGEKVLKRVPIYVD